MTLGKFLVALGSIVFLAYGIGFLVAPELMFRLVTNHTLTHSTALVDVRATYGGMSLGVGALLAVLATNEQSIRAGLLGVLFIMIGMATSRAVGIAVEQSADLMMWAYFAVEVFTALVVTYALLKKPISP